MPIDFIVFPARGFVLSAARGTVTYADCTSFLDTLVSDPAWRPGFRLLIDCSRIDALATSGGEIRLLAAQAGRLSESFGWGRIAVAAPEKPVYGVARMYQAYTDSLPRPLRVFREVSSAMKWLEAPSEGWSPDASKDEGRDPGPEKGSQAS